MKLEGGSRCPLNSLRGKFTKPSVIRAVVSRENKMLVVEALLENLCAPHQWVWKHISLPALPSIIIYINDLLLADSISNRVTSAVLTLKLMMAFSGLQVQYMTIAVMVVLLSCPWDITLIPHATKASMGEYKELHGW